MDDDFFSGEAQAAPQASDPPPFDETDDFLSGGEQQQGGVVVEDAPADGGFGEDFSDSVPAPEPAPGPAEDFGGDGGDMGGDMGDMGMGGGDMGGDMGGMGQQPAFTDDFGGGGAEPETGGAMPAPEDLEDTPLSRWQAEHQVHLQEKAAQSRTKHEEAKAEAENWISEFYKERSVAFENRQRANREAEEQFISGRDSCLTTGPVWERVCGLVDMTTRPDKDARDTTRLRQVLLQVKGNPPAHMEAR